MLVVRPFRIVAFRVRQPIGHDIKSFVKPWQRKKTQAILFLSFSLSPFLTLTLFIQNVLPHIYTDEPVSEFQTLLDKAVKLLNKYGISNCISSDSQCPASLRLEKAKVLYDISGRLLGMVRQCPMGSVGTLETVAQDGIRNYVNTYEDVHGNDPTACLR